MDGRNIITTTYKEVTRDNVIEIIQKAMPFFTRNAKDCDFLLNYRAGVQPLQRTEDKLVMPWIDQQAVDNVAKEICDFWEGYGFGVPISYIQRGDNGLDKAEGIKELNNCFYAAGSSLSQQKMAHYVVTCGHAFVLDELNREWEEGDSYFTRNVLDPRCAFVVHSSAYEDRRVVLGVSLRKTEDNIIFTAYSKDEIYFIYAEQIPTSKRVYAEKYDEWVNGYSWIHLEQSGDVNPMRRVCITEIYWTPDRTSVFENQISALDNINLLVSDISNGFEQNIQSLWWANNVDFQKKIVKDEEGNEHEVVVKPKNGDWLLTSSLRDGGNPSIEPLVIDYHLEDMQKSYTEQRQLALQRGHVPQRNETSGGSSGVAMDSASGWADAELVAASRNEVLKGCLLEELKVILAVIRESTDTNISDPILNVKFSDVEINLAKPKNSDVATRANSIATLLAKGFDLEDVLGAVALFPDNSQTIARSRKGVEKYQEATVWGSDTDEGRNQQDMSDNARKSPYLNA